MQKSMILCEGQLLIHKKRGMSLRNLLAVILSGIISSLLLADSLHVGQDTFGSALFMGYVFIFPGLLIVAFPFSFLINKVANRFEIGRFFIGFGMYMVLASIVTLLLLPLLFYFSFVVILVAMLFAVSMEVTKYIPDRFVSKSILISASSALLILFFTI